MGGVEVCRRLDCTPSEGQAETSWSVLICRYIWTAIQSTNKYLHLDLIEMCATSHVSLVPARSSAHSLGWRLQRAVAYRMQDPALASSAHTVILNRCTHMVTGHEHALFERLRHPGILSPLLAWTMPTTRR